LRDASRLLQEAGVDAEWHECDAQGGAKSGVPGLCADPLRQGEVIVRVTSAAPGVTNPRVLGEAVVDRDTGTGAFATVFADRIAVLARDSAVSYSSLLASVMAHEIAHLLNTNHASRGLMSATWSPAEVRHALARGWRFSPAEGERMRRTLRSRAEPSAPLLLPIASAIAPGGAPSAYPDLR